MPSGVQEDELRLNRVVDSDWREIAESHPDTAVDAVSGPINSLSVFGILAVAVEAVTAWPDSVTLLIRDTVRLSALAQDADSNVLPGRLVRWSTSDTAVATVDPLALVTGVGSGFATITAACEDRSATVEVSVKVLVFASIAAASYTTCGVTTDGEGYCWGRGDYGQLGDGKAIHRAKPVAALSGLRFDMVSPGYRHTCGLAVNGQAYCWGRNSYGALGDGSTVSRTVPGPVHGGLVFDRLSSGDNHTCAVTPTSSAYCWGSNGRGQLGQDPPPPEGYLKTPGPVAGGLSFTSIDGGSLHTCGATTDGDGYCWGINYDGRLGGGFSGRDQSTPVLVTGGLDFVSLTAGGYHSCGVTASGDAYCWGSNGAGELGNGSTDGTSSPILVAGGLTFASVTASSHTCGVTVSGEAYCWGQNGSGQLGDGSTANRYTPVPVAGALGFATLSTGWFHTCGITSRGTAYCWGRNTYGQLGDASLANTAIPVRVFGQR